MEPEQRYQAAPELELKLFCDGRELRSWSRSSNEFVRSRSSCEFVPAPKPREKLTFKNQDGRPTSFNHVPKLTLINVLTNYVYI